MNNLTHKDYKEAQEQCVKDVLTFSDIDLINRYFKLGIFNGGYKK